MKRGWCVLATLTLGSGVLASPARASSGPEQLTQLKLAEGFAIKVVVRQPGWLRVTQPQLLAAGLDPKADVRGLQLFTDGREQPLRVTGNGDAVFDAGEAIEFNAQGRDTLWTDARTYWLVAGTAGLRIPLVANVRGRAPPATFRATAGVRAHSFYYAALLNGDESNFGDAVGTTLVKQTLTLHHASTPANATLRLSLRGATTGDHQLPVSVNGVAVGACLFTGQIPYTCELPVSAAVVDGSNEIALSSQGPAPDFSLMAAVEIDYDHTFVADGDTLTLTAPPATRLALAGFTTADVRVVDVTDPSAPVELAPGIAFDGSSFVASVDTPGDTSDHTFQAFTDASVGAPASIVASHPSAWFDAPGAELVILSPAAFLEAARPLAKRRTEEGWSVALIDLQDIYDEFGGGDKSAFAIRAFLQYAHEHWQTPPRFGLFVGDATFDPRNFLAKGDFDFVPTKLVDTQEMEAASDDWFVDWNDDGVPEMALGRLAVRTSDEATQVVKKILDYAGTDDLPRGGLFVADQNGGGLDFEQASQLSAAVVADILPADRYFRGQPGSTLAGLLAKLNEGPFLVNYFGHGSITIWEGSLTGTAAAALTNQHASIYVSMNCLNGFFQDVYSESLAESLQKAPAGGAVAVWASSTVTSFDHQAALNREFLKRLTRTSLGEAAMAAKAANADPDTRRTWMLFGDPTLFGKPRTSSTDAGATDGSADAGAEDGPAEAGGASDGGVLDGGAGGADGASASADAGPGGVDASAEARPDAPGKPPGGDGCACRLTVGTESSLPSPGVTLAVLLAAVMIHRRRRSRPLPGLFASHLKFCRRRSDIGGACCPTSPYERPPAS